ncbi:MAG TPA: photosystem I reaction center subunit XI [Coleofasciculaceae cyanobacterium]
MPHQIIRSVGDGQIGNLATPISTSTWVLKYLNNLPAYRPGLSAFRRGLEVGMAHGYWLLGPFITLGPFRDAGLGNISGVLATCVLVLIASTAIWLYGQSNPLPPVVSLATVNPPVELSSGDGWCRYARGFLLGGIGGTLFAYVVLILVRLYDFLF